MVFRILFLYTDKKFNNKEKGFLFRNRKIKLKNYILMTIKKTELMLQFEAETGNN